MVRTQEEILERFKTVNDFLGIQRLDLVGYMSFENAKPYLKEEFVTLVESGQEKWEPFFDPKESILDYLPFAYEKARGERGISAGRSLLHFRTWIWLDDPEFYNEVLPLIDNYDNYGILALNKIAIHYGYIED